MDEGVIPDRPIGPAGSPRPGGWAWAAGLLEAQGAFYLTGVRRDRGRIQCRCPDVDVLERLRHSLGVGTLNGPYPSSGGSLGRKLTWVFQINRQDEVEQVAQRLGPQMGRRRRDQIAAMLHAMGAWTGGDVSRGTSLDPATEGGSIAITEGPTSMEGSV
jgi:hypothetical protein